MSTTNQAIIKHFKWSWYNYNSFNQQKVKKYWIQYSDVLEDLWREVRSKSKLRIKKEVDIMWQELGEWVYGKILKQLAIGTFRSKVRWLGIAQRSE